MPFAIVSIFNQENGVSGNRRVGRKKVIIIGYGENGSGCKRERVRENCQS